jgi:hypothetical protein
MNNTYQQESANIIVQKDKTKTELAQYMHACAFSPVLSTFQKAICMGHFDTWPGIYEINFEFFYTHQKQQHKGTLIKRDRIYNQQKT